MTNRTPSRSTFPKLGLMLALLLFCFLSLRPPATSGAARVKPDLLDRDLLRQQETHRLLTLSGLRFRL
ncbi:MAG: hypothetical protein U0263_34380 [Polyangiaceae bacterium]